MELTTSPEPHQEGQTLMINCQVPRVKENVSTEDLNLHIGQLALYKSTMTNNDDNTKRLTIDTNLHLDATINNTTITCVYSPQDGDLQSAYYTIHLSE